MQLAVLLLVAVFLYTGWFVNKNSMTRVEGDDKEKESKETKLATRLRTLESSLGIIKKALLDENVTSETATLDQLVAMRRDIDALSTKLKDAHGSDANIEKIAGTISRILEESQSRLRRDIEEHEERMKQFPEQVSAIEVRVDEQSRELQDLRADLDKTGERVGDQESKLSLLEKKHANQMSAQMTTIGKTIDVITTTVEKQERSNTNQFSALDRRVKTQAENIGRLGASLTDLQVGNDKSFSEVNDVLVKHEEKLLQSSNLLSTLDTALSEHARRLQENASVVGALDQRLTKETGQVNTKLAEQAARLQENASAVGALGQRLTEETGQVNTKLAEQAARLQENANFVSSLDLRLTKETEKQRADKEAAFGSLDQRLAKETGKINAAFEQQEERLSKSCVQVQSLDESIAKQKEMLASHDKVLEKHQEQLQAVTESTAKHSESMSEVLSKVTGLDSTVVKCQEQLQAVTTKHNESISEVLSKVTGLDSTVVKCQERVSEVSQNANSMKTALDDVVQSVTSLDNTVVKCQERVSEVTQNANSMKTALDDVVQSVELVKEIEIAKVRRDVELMGNECKKVDQNVETKIKAMNSRIEFGEKKLIDLVTQKATEVEQRMESKATEISGKIETESGGVEQRLLTKSNEFAKHIEEKTEELRVKMEAEEKRVEKLIAAKTAALEKVIETEGEEMKAQLELECKRRAEIENLVDSETKRLDSELDAREKKLEQLVVTKGHDVTKQIELNDEKIDRIGSAQTKLENSVAEHERHLANLRGNEARQNNELLSLSARAADFDKKLGVFAEEMKKVDDEKEKLVELRSDLRADMHKKVEIMEKRVAQTETSLETKTVAVDNQIATTNAKIDNIAKQLVATTKELEKRLDEHREDFENVEAKTQEHTKDISDTNTKLEEMEKQMLQNQIQQINTVELKTQEINKEVVASRKKLETIEKQIFQNQIQQINKEMASEKNFASQLRDQTESVRHLVESQSDKTEKKLIEHDDKLAELENALSENAKESKETQTKKLTDLENALTTSCESRAEQTRKEIGKQIFEMSERSSKLLEKEQTDNRAHRENLKQFVNGHVTEIKEMVKTNCANLGELAREQSEKVQQILESKLESSNAALGERITSLKNEQDERHQALTESCQSRIATNLSVMKKQVYEQEKKVEERVLSLHDQVDTRLNEQKQQLAEQKEVIAGDIKRLAHEIEAVGEIKLRSNDLQQKLERKLETRFEEYKKDVQATIESQKSNDRAEGKLEERLEERLRATTKNVKELIEKHTERNNKNLKGLIEKQGLEQSSCVADVRNECEIKLQEIEISLDQGLKRIDKQSAQTDEVRLENERNTRNINEQGEKLATLEKSVKTTEEAARKLPGLIEDQAQARQHRNKQDGRILDLENRVAENAEKLTDLTDKTPFKKVDELEQKVVLHSEQIARLENTKALVKEVAEEKYAALRKEVDATSEKIDNINQMCVGTFDEKLQRVDKLDKLVAALEKEVAVSSERIASLLESQYAKTDGDVDERLKKLLELKKEVLSQSGKLTSLLDMDKRLDGLQAEMDRQDEKRGADVALHSTEQRKLAQQQKDQEKSIVKLDQQLTSVKTEVLVELDSQRKKVEEVSSKTGQVVAKVDQLDVRINETAAKQQKRLAEFRNMLSSKSNEFQKLVESSGRKLEQTLDQRLGQQEDKLGKKIELDLANRSRELHSFMVSSFEQREAKHATTLDSGLRKSRDELGKTVESRAKFLETKITELQKKLEESVAFIVENNMTEERRTLEKQLDSKLDAKLEEHQKKVGLVVENTGAIERRLSNKLETIAEQTAANTTTALTEYERKIEQKVALKTERLQKLIESSVSQLEMRTDASLQEYKSRLVEECVGRTDRVEKLTEEGVQQSRVAADKLEAKLTQTLDQQKMALTEIRTEIEASLKIGATVCNQGKKLEQLENGAVATNQQLQNLQTTLERDQQKMTDQIALQIESKISEQNEKFNERVDAQAEHFETQIQRVEKERTKQVSELNVKIDDQIKRTDQLGQVCELEKKKFDEHNKRLSDHSKRLDEQSGKLQQCGSDIEELKSGLVAADGKFVKFLRLQNDEHNKQCDKHSKRLDSHSDKLQNLLTLSEKLEKTVESNSKRALSLQQKVDAQAGKTDELQKRLQSQSQSVTASLDLQKKLSEELSEKVGLQSTKIHDQIAKTAELEKTLESYSKRTDELLLVESKQTGKLQKDVELHASKTDLVEKTLQSLSKEATDKFESQAKAAELLQQKVETHALTVDARVKKDEEEIASLQKKLDSHVTKTVQLEKWLADHSSTSDAELESHKKKVAQLQQSLETRRSKMEQLETQFDAYSKKADKGMSAHSSLLEKFRTDLASQSKKLAGLEETQRKLTSLQVDNRDLTAQIRAQLRTIENIKSDLRKEIDSQLQKINRQVGEHDARLGDLKSNINAYSIKLEYLDESHTDRTTSVNQKIDKLASTTEEHRAKLKEQANDLAQLKQDQKSPTNLSEDKDNEELLKAVSDMIAKQIRTALSDELTSVPRKLTALEQRLETTNNRLYMESCALKCAFYEVNSEKLDNNNALLVDLLCRDCDVAVLHNMWVPASRVTSSLRYVGATDTMYPYLPRQRVHYLALRLTQRLDQDDVEGYITSGIYINPNLNVALTKRPYSLPNQIDDDTQILVVETKLYDRFDVSFVATFPAKKNSSKNSCDAILKYLKKLPSNHTAFMIGDFGTDLNNFQKISKRLPDDFKNEFAFCVNKPIFTSFLDSDFRHNVHIVTNGTILSFDSKQNSRKAMSVHSQIVPKLTGKPSQPKKYGAESSLFHNKKIV